MATVTENATITSTFASSISLAAPSMLRGSPLPSWTITLACADPLAKASPQSSRARYLSAAHGGALRLAWAARPLLLGPTTAKAADDGGQIACEGVVADHMLLPDKSRDDA